MNNKNNHVERTSTVVSGFEMSDNNHNPPLPFIFGTNNNYVAQFDPQTNSQILDKFRPNQGNQANPVRANPSDLLKNDNLQVNSGLYRNGMNGKNITVVTINRSGVPYLYEMNNRNNHTVSSTVTSRSEMNRNPNLENASVTLHNHVSPPTNNLNGVLSGRSGIIVQSHNPGLPNSSRTCVMRCTVGQPSTFGNKFYEAQTFIPFQNGTDVNIVQHPNLLGKSKECSSSTIQENVIHSDVFPSSTSGAVVSPSNNQKKLKVAHNVDIYNNYNKFGPPLQNPFTSFSLAGEVASNGNHPDPSSLSSNITSSEDREFYELHKGYLKELFPDIPETVLINSCCKVGNTASLNEIVDYILGLNYATPDPITEVEHNLTAEEVPVIVNPNHKIWLDTLISVLPNADPEYLSDCCTNFFTEDDVNQFVTQKLEENNFPTRASYEKRKEMNELWQKFTNAFTVQEFVKLFPDPVKYFSEKEIVKTEELFNISMAYLKKRYRCIKMQDLTRNLVHQKYNLYKTCKVLDVWRDKMKTRRSQYQCQEIKHTNFAFLHETCFIEHEQEIVNYISGQKHRREVSYELARINRELLTCACCYDDKIVEEMDHCKEGHLFCKECITRGTDMAISEGKTRFPCFNGECGSDFDIKTLQPLIDPKVFSRLLQRIQYEEVMQAEIDDIESCPFCDFVAIVPKENKVFTCYNAECRKESCRLCKELNHIPLHCDEVEKDAATQMRVYIENKMTEALIRNCYRCNKKFIKSEGCNKMTCICGATMCYICRQPIKDYNHFASSTKVNETYKCPLYSDIKALHANEVQTGGEKAKDEVLAMNPQVELFFDPTTIDKSKK